jgi:hypothetical protein
MSFNAKTSGTAAPLRPAQYIGPYLLQKTLGKGQTGIYIFVCLFSRVFDHCNYYFFYI